MSETSAQAIVIEVGGRPTRVEPGTRCVLGRGTDADVVISHADISRRHAQIAQGPGGWTLSDMGSSNGTWVNGVRCHAPIPLSAGMEIFLGGPSTVSVRIGSAPAGRATGEKTAMTTPMSTPTEPVLERPLMTGPTNPAQLPNPSQSPPAGHPNGPSNQTSPLPGRPGGSHVRGENEATESASASSPLPQGNAPRPVSYGTPMPAVTGPVRLPKGPARAPSQRRNVGEVFDHLDDAAFTRATSTAGTEAGTVIGALPQVMPKATGALTIGRGQDNQIVLKDLLASRQHARLLPVAGGFEVTDLGSRNGTFINGHRVNTGLLREDDLLAIGRARFTVKNGHLVASQDEGNVNFVANHLSFTLPNGKKLIDDVSFGLDGSSLVAVIGPSGAGKSTLLKALIGAQKATEGEVYYDGRDLYDNYDDLRQRIGVVPQDDVVHHQLTVRQALRYAAELRFPDDLPKAERDARVEEVIDELGLTQHAETQVARLSGGQRKRTSVALELLTSPSLLFLDEPTSGLDPGLDKRVMMTLRGLADGGRTVVVITHNVASLGVCDRVLLLAPGGRVAFFGPPEEMLPYFNAADHADVFNIVTDDPEGSQRHFAGSPQMQDHVAAPLSAPRSPSVAANSDDAGHRQQSIPKQLSTLVRRQARVILADKGFVGFMLLLPLVLGGLALLVPGSHGLHTVRFAEELAAAGGDPKQVVLKPESSQIMTLLVMGSVFMGLAMTIRELVAERPIFLREKAVGLSSFSYLTSKVLTYGLFLAVQVAIMVALVIVTKSAPDEAVVLGNPTLEVFLLCLLTGLAAIGFGLLLSSLAKTSEQVMPMLVIAIMGALVFSGGLFELQSAAMRLAGTVFPSRWGLAMGAQTVDVKTSLTLPDRDRDWDPFWIRDAAKWTAAALALLAQFVVTFLGAYVFTKRRKAI